MDFARRTETVLKLFPKMKLDKLISHVYDFTDASKAYELIDKTSRRSYGNCT